MSARTSPTALAEVPALLLEEVHAPFGDAGGRGLRGVSLQVGPGERVALLGPSGAGKTTLLRVVAGLAALEHGRVAVGGRDVTALPPERRGAVYLHQTPVLFPHLTVGENVAFALRVGRAPEAEVAAAVERALAAVRLDGWAARRPFGLSGGERHRVALARAVAARPAVLLLDEPLAALDPSLRAEVRAAIAAAQRESGAALVLVTHDLDDAGALADRVAVLLDGAVAQLDTPARLFTRPASLAVARFLGTFVELRGTVREDGAFAGAFGALPPGDGTAAVHVGREAVAVLPRHALQLRPSDGSRDRGAEAPERWTIVGVARGVRHGLAGPLLRVGLPGSELELPLGGAPAPAEGTTVQVVADPRHATLFAADG